MFFIFAARLSGDNPSSEKKEFDKYNALTWKEAFAETGKGKWEERWFLDGKKAAIKKVPQGFDLKAGPKARDDAHHAVLWTKQSFKGDIKIEVNDAVH